MTLESKSSLPTVGIDLGTTRSVVAHVDEFGRPRTLLNAEGEMATPSAVLFEEGAIVVGREAIRALSASSESVAQFAKREFGNPSFSMEFDGVAYPPEMIQSFVLGKLRRDAERVLGHAVQSAVLTVPAFFDEPKRRATIDAGLLAGIDVKAIINEPTAAALAFGAVNGLLDEQGAFAKPQVILVYDLGGGTFDVSLLRIQGREVKVVAVDGNSRLGGLDWDKCLVEWMIERLASREQVPADALAAARANLMHEAEELKHALSARRSVKVRTRVGEAMLSCELTRETFDELTAHLLDRTRFTARKLLADCDMTWLDVDRILLVGGSTRMPQVGEMLASESGVTVDASLSPDEAVAHGAAVYASLVIDEQPSPTETTEPIRVTDVNAHHLGVVGVEQETGRPVRHVMIAKNTPLPAKKASRFHTIDDGQPSVLVRVVEGGDGRGKHATEIGRFVVHDLPPELPAGSPVDIYFRYDRDGIIEVEAKVPSTRKRASIRIERASGLSASDREGWRDKTREIFEALGLG